MKKFSLFVCALCVSAMVAANGLVVDFSSKLNPWNLPTDYVIGEQSYTDGTTTIQVNGAGYSDKGTIKGGAKWYPTNKDSSACCLIMGKKDSYVKLPALNYNVSKILVYGTSGGSGSVTFNVFVGTTAVSTGVTGCKDVMQTFKIDSTYQGKGNVYTIKVTNANNIQISKIEVIEAVTGKPEEPVFTPKAGTYTSAQNVTLSCATDGAEIQYSFDGSTFMTYTSPIEVEDTQTIYAKGVKGGLESDVAAATYVIVSTQGDGSKDNPYTVEDVQKLHNPGDSAWVTGYILGCAAQGGKLAKADTVNTNVLLGMNATDSTGVPVSLSKKADKETLGLKDHPGNKGRILKVYGALVEYFSVPGIKNVSDYELSPASGISGVKAEQVGVNKRLEDGRMVIEKEGVWYMVDGKKLGQKGLK